MDQLDRYADAHAHIQDCLDIEQVMLSAKENQVEHIVCNSTTLDYLPICLQKQYPFIIPCIGLHPWYLPIDKTTIDYLRMEEILKQDPLVQVGEIGLDFMKGKEKVDQHEQCDIFRKQFELALKYNRSVSIHCVRASGEMLKILKKQLKNYKECKFDSAIIMHSYNCPIEITKSLDKLYPNFYYSFSLSVVNKMENIINIQKDKLLFESDAPYQYQQKVVIEESQKSHPKHLRQLLQLCGEYLNEPNLKQIVFNNFRKALKLI